jgi:thioesterase domain-containing protein/acyl carrier protein
MYGPTETTIWSTVAHVGDDAGPITIGRPIANTEVLVVDANRVPVPVGVVGELLIGGVGLAGGYLGRPELTRDRFVPHPLGGDSTVYRTGDLVRWRPDGTLSCLGRIDHQVKIHGHRVELGEIEAALSRHPSVADCVVVAADDGHDGKRLVAYVAGRPPAAVDELELRRAVAGSLPGYMVPSVVVSLPALPRTPNGKVDRAALPPAVDRHRAGADGRAVAPRTEMEARLAQLWEEVLGVAPIGVTDDFFELGVDSLTAARLFARIEREFGRRLPFAPVFAAPSIEALAAMLVDGDPEARRFSALVPIHVGGGRVPVFGVHGGAGTILLYHELARRLGPDQPFYGLQAVGLHGDEAPQTTIAAMAGRYVKEIRDIRPHGPYVLVGYCFGGLVAFEMGRLLESAGEAITLVAMLNAPSPGYIRRFDPVFDGEGALTDDEGALVERARPTEDRSVGGRIRRRLSSQQTLPARAKALTDSARRAVVRTVRYRLAEGRFRMLLILRRPLPDSMRENVAFQRIAARAQAGYDPPPAAFPILVARAAGLYHQDDLGWRPYTTGPVETVEVPGEQRVPRDTMREPHVAQVAAAFERLVRDGQAQGAVGSRADG